MQSCGSPQTIFWKTQQIWIRCAKNKIILTVFIKYLDHIMGTGFGVYLHKFVFWSLKDSPQTIFEKTNKKLYTMFQKNIILTDMIKYFDQMGNDFDVYLHKVAFCSWKGPAHTIIVRKIQNTRKRC